MMTRLARLGRTVADHLGRQSRIVRWLRPLYETALAWLAGGHGIPWTINGVSYRIDPRHRHQMGAAYDAALATWLAARVRPGQITIDVGANVGVYVLQFAHWSRPDGVVVAVEPNPTARAVLERHVLINHLGPRVVVVPAAIGAAPGVATLFAATTDGMSRLGAPNPLLADHVRSLAVPVTTLDDLCTAQRLAPDWLFLDVEGFEIAALSGARRLFAARGATLGVIVEMHPDAWSIAGTNRSTAEGLFRELGRYPEPLSGQSDPLGTHGHVWLRPV